MSKKVYASFLRGPLRLLSSRWSNTTSLRWSSLCKLSNKALSIVKSCLWLSNHLFEMVEDIWKSWSYIINDSCPITFPEHLWSSCQEGNWCSMVVGRVIFMANQTSFYFKIVFLWKGRCDNIKLQNYPADYLLKLVEKLDTFVTLSTFEQFVTLKYCISQLHYTTYYCQIKNMINNIWYKVKYQICSWKFSYFEKIEKFQFWRTIKKHDHGAWSSEGFVFVWFRE